jgi:hypothetical protein
MEESDLLHNLAALPPCIETLTPVEKVRMALQPAWTLKRKTSTLSGVKPLS